MKNYRQDARFIMVNSSGRVLYKAEHIEGIEFRLYEGQIGKRDILKRTDKGSYRFYNDWKGN